MTSPRPDARDLGHRAEVTELFAPYRDRYRLARVTRTDRAGADLLVVTETSVEPLRATFGGGVLSDAAADRSYLPVVGDWVAVQSWCDDRSTVEVVLPRRTVLDWHAIDRSSHDSAMVANVDVVMLVEPVVPGPDLARIQRLGALAQGSGARAVVALTKADLVPGAADHVAEVSEVASHLAVVPLSTETGEGIDQLTRELAGSTTLAVGPSGAGRSTLVNTLVVTLVDTVVDPIANPGFLDAEGIARQWGDDGHELVVLPGLGSIIDTPGLRPLRLVS